MHVGGISLDAAEIAQCVIFGGAVRVWFHVFEWSLTYANPRHVFVDEKSLANHCVMYTARLSFDLLCSWFQIRVLFAIYVCAAWTYCWFESHKSLCSNNRPCIDFASTVVMSLLVQFLERGKLTRTHVWSFDMSKDHRTPTTEILGILGTPSEWWRLW